MMTAPPARLDPVALLHSETPLRVWSLIVTIFGDAVMNRGTLAKPPPVWIADLMELLALVGIDAGIARTNLSRLVANGTLLRDKAGRNTYYRLSEASSADFTGAARRIYTRQLAAPAGSFHLVTIDLCANRAAARKTLEDAGFRFLGPCTGLLPAITGTETPELPGDAILAIAEPTEPLRRAAADLWQISALNAGYRRFVAEFAPLADGASAEDISPTDLSPTPAEAIALRIGMVHRFRRLALRDPGLPPAVLPEDWAGDAACSVFDRLTAKLEIPSESWLSRHGFRR